jgi:hypothetical protein
MAHNKFMLDIQMTAVWMYIQYMQQQQHHALTNYSLGEEIMNRKLWKSIYPQHNDAIDHFGKRLCGTLGTPRPASSCSKPPDLHFAT